MEPSSCNAGSRDGDNEVRIVKSAASFDFLNGFPHSRAQFVKSRMLKNQNLKIAESLREELSALSKVRPPDRLSRSCF